MPALFYCLKRQKERKKYIMKTVEGVCEVKTNIGTMPLEDYLDIEAMKLGFDEYEDLKNNGYTIESDKE